ncbi:MAG: tyrosine-type recombinase/integrase, partial [Acidimicrobiales bacterium]
MTGTVQILARARGLGQAPYDRERIATHLEEMTTSLLIADGSVVPRRRRAIHAVCDVLDGLEGQRPVDRWALFESEAWPGWKSGDDRPQLGDEWSFGVRAFAISRMVCPSVGLSLQVRVAHWFDLLPADDPFRRARDELRAAMTTALVGSAKSHEEAINTGARLMLACGVDQLGELTEDDMLKLPPGTKGADVLDSVLCQLGVFDRTPRGGTSRRLTAPRHTPRELAVIHGVPEPFVDVVATYLETYARRLSDAYGTLRHKARSLGHFFRYLQAEHPQVDSCADITPAQARGFVGHAVELARRSQRQRDRKGTADRTTAHSWLIDVRVFFADLCTWATEEGSPFTAHAPAAVPLTRHDLLDAGFRKARQRRDAWMTSTVLDLQREIPNIRAFALRRWHEADQALRTNTEEPKLVEAERAAFWDWALLELLITSGLRVEEACELTTLDVLKRRLHDRRLYYLLHVKPSKFGRARVVPIGDQLGQVIAEIIRHVRDLYHSNEVPPCDRRDEHEKRPLPRAPYLLQGMRHPSTVNTNTIRGRLRWLSGQAGARHADGSPLVLTPHDCRRVFASEHLNAHTPVHVIQALLGHATINTVMIYAKLYPTELVEEYRKAMRGLYGDVYGPDATTTPTAEEWAAFAASCSLRDMGTHICALPTGEHCPRGLVCLGCSHAQPKKSAAPTFRRMLASHTRALERARDHG